jgi:hypothetical protein
MSRAHTSRFAARDRGLRRVRTVTAWSAAGSAGLAVATAIALVPATASPASDRATTGGADAGTAPAGAPGAGATTDRPADPTRSPAGQGRPHPRHTSAPRLTPPTTPPAAAGNGSQHTSSGGS